MNATHPIEALPKGFQLLWYEIKEILGQGGFGYTYLAVDRNLNQNVALKEFMPAEFVARDASDFTVKPTDEDKRAVFEWGLDRFRREAQTLAQFKHPNIVRVLSVFDQNKTSYMVMEYEQGKALDVYLKNKKEWTQRQLLQLILPILDGLNQIHKAGFIHRDIKPSNIYLRADQTPVLIDFGSARNLHGAKTHALTSLVTHGYAPFEQYSVDSDQQGPWTDIYSLGATLYFAITGHKPPDAMLRANSLISNTPDPYKPLGTLVKVGRFSPEFLNAVDKALQIKASDRPQSTESWKRMLTAGRSHTSHTVQQSPAQSNDRKQVKPDPSASRLDRTKSLAASAYDNVNHVDSDKRASGGGKIVRALGASVLALAALYVGGYQLHGYLSTPKYQPFELPSSSQSVADTAPTAPELSAEASLPSNAVVSNTQHQLAQLFDQLKSVKRDSSISFSQMWQRQSELLSEMRQIDPTNGDVTAERERLFTDVEEVANGFVIDEKILEAREALGVLKAIGAPLPMVNELRSAVEKTQHAINERENIKREKQAQASKDRERRLAQAREQEIELRKPARSGPAVSSAPSSKATPSVSTSVSAQDAMFIMGQFKMGIEAGNIEKVTSMSTTSDEKKAFLKNLMQEFPVVETRVDDFQFVKSKNTATATLQIVKLKNRNGRNTTLTGGSEKLSLVVHYSEAHGWELNW